MAGKRALGLEGADLALGAVRNFGELDRLGLVLALLRHGEERAAPVAAVAGDTCAMSHLPCAPAALPSMTPVIHAGQAMVANPLVWKPLVQSSPHC